MRILIAGVLCSAMTISCAMAAEAGDLLPGKPAGVKQAQMELPATPYLVAGALAVGAAILISTQTGSGGTATSSTSTSP